MPIMPVPAAKEPFPFQQGDFVRALPYSVVHEWACGGVLKVIGTNPTRRIVSVVRAADPDHGSYLDQPARDFVHVSAAESRKTRCCIMGLAEGDLVRPRVGSKNVYRTDWLWKVDRVDLLQAQIDVFAVSDEHGRPILDDDGSIGGGVGDRPYRGTMYDMRGKPFLKINQKPEHWTHAIGVVATQPIVPIDLEAGSSHSCVAAVDPHLTQPGVVLRSAGPVPTAWEEASLARREEQTRIDTWDEYYDDHMPRKSQLRE